MKQIHATLLASKAKHSTTLCRLRKIGPLPDGSYRTMASLDVDVVYDDGLGAKTYKARTGYQQSAIVATADLGVDNAEGETLVAIESFETEGITQAQIDAGYFDKVPFVVYEVDYNDLTTGHHEIVNGGTIGEQRMKYGQIAVLEERSLSNQLKQQIVDLDSITCRAIFGSQPLGTGGGVVEERFPCGFDASTLWVSSAITSVDVDEPDRKFTDTSLIASGENFYVPGVVHCLTGANAGQKREVEAFDTATGEVTLQFPFVNSAEVGDTYEIRPDCSHEVEGNNGCRFHFGTDWGDHYRGEPWIPVGQTANLNTPGAGISGSVNVGTGEAV